jgi:hypothetical protein
MFSKQCCLYPVDFLLLDTSQHHKSTMIKLSSSLLPPLVSAARTSHAKTPLHNSETFTLDGCTAEDEPEHEWIVCGEVGLKVDFCVLAINMNSNLKVC